MPPNVMVYVPLLPQGNGNCSATATNVTPIVKPSPEPRVLRVLGVDAVLQG